MIQQYKAMRKKGVNAEERMFPNKKKLMRICPGYTPNICG